VQDQARGRSLAFHPNVPAIVRFDPFRFDLVDGTLWRGAEEVRLPPRALVILRHLVERAGRVVPKQTLIEAAWKDAFVNEASLTEAIALIRQALGDDPQQPSFVQTVHRRGYRFIAPVAVDTPAASPTAMDSTADAAVSAPSAARGAVDAALPPDFDVLHAPRRSIVPMAATALVAATAAAIGTLVWTRPDTTRSPSPTRLSLTLPSEQAPAPGLSAHPVVAVTPDGTRVVYVGGRPGASRLFIRRMDQFAATPIAGTDGAHGPFISPDGQWVAFFAGGSLQKVRLDGGEPQTICATPTGVGGVWLSATEIVFVPDWTSPLLRVNATGGTPQVAVAAPPGFGYRWPDRIDDHTVLATRWRATARTAALVALDLTSGAERVIVEPAAFGRFAADGHLVFVRDGIVYATLFDRATGRMSGTPVQVADAVLTGTTGSAQLAIAPTGAMLFIGDAPERSHRVLAGLNRAGQIRDLPAPPRAFRAFSVCQERIAATIHDRGQSDLWVGRLDRAALTKITSEGTTYEPTWSTDCATLTFGWNRTGVGQMHIVRPGSGEAPRQLLTSAGTQVPGSWSPDNRRLAFVEQHPAGKSDIWLLDVQTGSAHALIASPADEILPRLSPDGRWIAYESDATGRFEIEVASVASGARLQVSDGGGTWPSWSVDGRQLFYLESGTLYRVDLRESGGELGADDPVQVYRHPDLVLFRATAEGFVILRRTTEHLPLTRVDVVLNAFAEAESNRP
jgi:eukaryotic-like serine/threonine-protein kinase